MGARPAGGSESAAAMLSKHISTNITAMRRLSCEVLLSSKRSVKQIFFTPQGSCMGGRCVRAKAARSWLWQPEFLCIGAVLCALKRHGPRFGDDGSDLVLCLQVLHHAARHEFEVVPLRCRANPLVSMQCSASNIDCVARQQPLLPGCCNNIAPQQETVNDTAFPNVRIQAHGEITCSSLGSFIWNQGWRLMSSSRMRLLGSGTKIRLMRSMHPLLSSKSVGKLYCALTILCTGVYARVSNVAELQQMRSRW